MTPTTALVALCCLLAFTTMCMSAAALLAALVALGASYRALRNSPPPFSKEHADDTLGMVPSAGAGGVHRPGCSTSSDEPDVAAPITTAPRCSSCEWACVMGPDNTYYCPACDTPPSPKDWVLSSEELHWSVAPGTWSSLQAALVGMGVTVIAPQDARGYETYGVFHKGGWVWMSADEHRQHCPRSPIIGVK